MRRRTAVLTMSFALFGLTAPACSRSPAPTASSGLQVGSAAPGFSLPSAQGGMVSLAEFLGHKPVLLYFSMGPG